MATKYYWEETDGKLTPLPGIKTDEQAVQHADTFGERYCEGVVGNVVLKLEGTCFMLAPGGPGGDVYTWTEAE